MLMVKRTYIWILLTYMHDQAFWLDNGPYQKSADSINRFLEILASKFYKNCEKWT